MISAKSGSSAKQADAGVDGQTEKGVDVSHPLQTYYINIPTVSKLENHAFTAAKTGTATSGPVLLFQRSTPWSPKRKQKKQDKEWTWKVSDKFGNESPAPDSDDDAIENAESRKEVQVRVEGPYVPYETTAFETADAIICIVGGTGLTGAYSLAMWWLANRSKESNKSFALIWTVRHRETALLSEWREMEYKVRAEGNGRVALRVHVSSEEGRIDVSTVVRECLTSQASVEGKAVPSDVGVRKAWVYVSGPEGLLRQAEDACVNLEYELRLGRRKKTLDEGLATVSLDHYVAKWEV